MSKNKKKSNYILGVVGEGNSKKCSLASLLSKLSNEESTLSGEESKRREYVLDSVFPSSEVRDEALGVIAENDTEVMTDDSNTGTKRPTYTLSSVFPNKEVQDIALAEIDRNNKKRLCEELGICYDNIDDISWEEIISVMNDEKKKPRKGKLLMKIRGEGV